MSEQLEKSVEAIRFAIAEASKNLIERETLVELVALAAVAQEHFLIIGAPGTAKSEAVRRIAKATGGNYLNICSGVLPNQAKFSAP